MGSRKWVVAGAFLVWGCSTSSNGGSARDGGGGSSGESSGGSCTADAGCIANSSGGSGGAGNGSGGNDSSGGASSLGGTANAGGRSDTDGGNAGGTAAVGGCAPLDLMILFDQSGSMGNTLGTGSRWTVATNALTSYLSDPTSQNVDVALSYFPNTAPDGGAATGGCSTNADCGPNGTCLFGNCIITGPGASCDVADYAPEVPAALPPNHARAIASIPKHDYGGSSPILPAVNAMATYATGWASQHSGRNVAVVLATDGGSDACGQTGDQGTTEIEDAIGKLFRAGVSTYVIGLGNTVTDVTRFAIAGGTTAPVLIDGTNGTPSTLYLNALKTIQMKASCNLPTPTP